MVGGATLPGGVRKYDPVVAVTAPRCRYIILSAAAELVGSEVREDHLALRYDRFHIVRPIQQHVPARLCVFRSVINACDPTLLQAQSLFCCILIPAFFAQAR